MLRTILKNTSNEQAQIRVTTIIGKSSKNVQLSLNRPWRPIGL
jgi:hypothetical protein